MFLSFIEKIKNQNAYLCKLKKNLKVSPFHSQKCVDQKYLWRSRNYLEPSKPIIRFLTIVFINLGKGKRQKVKNSIFDDPLIINQPFFTNWIYYWQIRFCTYYAFSLNQMSDIRKVWKYWPLKDGFCLISQKLFRAAILWWVDQKDSNF